MLATLDEYFPAFVHETCCGSTSKATISPTFRKSKSTLLNRYLTGPFTQPDLARQADIDRALRDELPRLEAAEREAASAGGEYVGIS